MVQRGLSVSRIKKQLREKAEEKYEKQDRFSHNRHHHGLHQLNYMTLFSYQTVTDALNLGDNLIREFRNHTHIRLSYFKAVGIALKISDSSFL